MNIDFHYYGTYTACCLAGLDQKTSELIAHAAQFVDDCTSDYIGSHSDEYIETCQTNEEMMMINWSEVVTSKETFKLFRSIWTPFHFLPGDLTAIAAYAPSVYKEAIGHEGESYKSTGNDPRDIKLVCLPLSKLSCEIFNGVKLDDNNQASQAIELGLKLHVLADTWAHRYFAGIPSHLCNTTKKGADVINLTEGKFKGKPFEFDLAKELPKEFSLDDKPEENFYFALGDFPLVTNRSVLFLGHGQMGHIPDYSFLSYKYFNKCTEGAAQAYVIKENPKDYKLAFAELVNRIEYSKGKASKLINTEAELESYLKAKPKFLGMLDKVLNKMQCDSTESWKKLISEYKGEAGETKTFPTPKDYDIKWFSQNYLPVFEEKAKKHLDFVLQYLEANHQLDQC